MDFTKRSYFLITTKQVCPKASKMAVCPADKTISCSVMSLKNAVIVISSDLLRLESKISSIF